MSRSSTEVGDVYVLKALDLYENDIKATDTTQLTADGILLVRSPNILIDLEGATRTIRGIRFLDGDDNAFAPNSPPVVGPVTIAAYTSSGDPALMGLMFVHLSLDPAVSDTERIAGSHGSSVVTDALMRPIQLFFRSTLDGGNGAWLVPDWAA